ATLAIIGWFALERRAPSRRTWLVFGCLILVWANLHSLFALAPMLLFAALLGVLGQTVWEWRLLDGAACEDALRRNRSVAVALVLAICLTICLSLINPRGVDQLLTFLSSSQHTAIWSVKDEWSHFDPFVASNNPGSVSPLLWGVMNGVMIAFALSTMIGTRALVRRHKGALDRFDPVLFGLGLASIVAILMSVRFLWMAIFPLLFVARAIGRAKLLRDNRGPISWVLALCAVVLAVQFYRVGGFATTVLRLPETAVEYLATPHLSRNFHVEGVRFLPETSVEGRLFNDYGMGGFLGYWLSPGLRTFIDSRTEHYPPEVVREYTRIRQLKESGGIGTILDLLDRREVDFFFGTGMPRGLVDRSGGSTVGHLDYVPGWILVSRSLDHAIYLRDLPRNEDSLRKIARYYRAAGIPFDRKRGFDVATAIDADLDWAVAHDLLTPAQSERIAGRSSEDVTVRANALETLALVYTLGGSYRAMLTIEAELDRLRAPTAAALRRRVLAHIKLDQPARAIEAAAQLVKAEGRNARSLVFQQLATAFAEISRGTRGRLPKPARQIALARVAQRVPLLTPFEAGMLQRALPGEPRVDAPR
ncbi:MAG: hypothetical protein GY944_18225, partial [bacterium]|nr:hypothetical protein [bacterium]